MKLKPTISERADKLLQSPAGVAAETVQVRQTGASQAGAGVLDQISDFAGLDAQLGTTKTQPSTKEIKSNQFKAAILAVRGAEAAMAAVGRKLEDGQQLTKADVKSLGPRMIKAAQALEEAIADGAASGEHKKDATQLLASLSGVLRVFAEYGDRIGLTLGHKAELATVSNPDQAQKEAAQFWQQLTGGDVRVAGELNESLKGFYSAADRVLGSVSKLMSAGKKATHLLEPVEVAFADPSGYRVDTRWNPRTSELKVSIGGMELGTTWFDGNKMGPLYYTQGFPGRMRVSEEALIKAVLAEYDHRDGKVSGQLDDRFDALFKSQADVDRAAKLESTTFAPIEVTWNPPPAPRVDQIPGVASPGRVVQVPATIQWDPTWGTLEVTSGSFHYHLTLEHPAKKGDSIKGPPVPEDELRQLLLDALQERKGDSSPASLHKMRVALGILAA
jgi:hypothetical protein